jgi:hypothetical protein
MHGNLFRRLKPSIIPFSLDAIRPCNLDMEKLMSLHRGMGLSYVL